MAFYGSEFLFDGRSCREYGLEMYDFGSTTQGDVSFPSTGKIHEERLLSRYSSLFYGVSQNQALEFTLVFGPTIDAIDAGVPMDRYEIADIAGWLTGHNEYKWLDIIQPDTIHFRYKCIVSDLKLITYGKMPWAFSCKISCDSPFAYTFPKTFTYKVAGESNNTLLSESTYNGYYKPKIILSNVSGGSFSIMNKSDNDRIFAFQNLPAIATEISIDNDTMIIKHENGSLNLYPYFNYHFFRLVRGKNELYFKGNADVSIICEFPVNIGG